MIQYFEHYEPAKLEAVRPARSALALRCGRAAAADLDRRTPTASQGVAFTRKRSPSRSSGNVAPTERSIGAPFGGSTPHVYMSTSLTPSTSAVTSAPSYSRSCP